MTDPINLTQLRKRIHEFTSVTHSTSGQLVISVNVTTLLALIDTAEAARAVVTEYVSQQRDQSDLFGDLEQTLARYQP